MITLKGDKVLSKEYGITKREFFAAVALHGLLAAGHPAKTSAKNAVRVADQLIDQLNDTRDFAEEEKR